MTDLDAGAREGATEGFDRLAAAAAACSPDAILTIDVDGRVTSVNAAAENLLGWTADQLLGRPAATLVPADRAEEADGLDRGLPGLAAAQTLETERLHRSGERVPVLLRRAPLTVDGRRLGSVAVLRDMSAELAVRRELRYARRIAESRFEQSVFPMASLAPDGTVQQANDALCEISGYAAEDLVGRSYAEFMLPAEVDDAAANQARVLSGDLRWSRNQRMLRKADGTYLETLVSLSALHDDAGAVARLEVAIEDVSAVLAAERALRASENRWRALALRSSDVAFLADAGGTLLFASPSLGEHFGYDAGEVVGRSGFDFFHREDVALARAEWDRAVGLVGTPVTFRGRARHADGTWRWIEVTATNWISDPDIGAVVANVTDVTALVRAEQRLGAGDTTDPLTGVASRRAVLAEVERMLAAAQPPAVLVVDVDGFRGLNAMYSHGCGDEVLVELSQRISGLAGQHDVVGRVGGDRFAVLVAAAGGSRELEALAERLLQVAAEPVAVGGDAVRVQVSVGAVAALDAAAAGDPAAVLAVAEAALREAKTRGSSQVHVHDGRARTSSADAARTVADLRRGLHHGELLAHYQPLIELATGRAVGAEALVRWQHPDRGLLLPAHFLGAAEDSGLILELGAQVLEHACRTAARWAEADAFGGPFHVAVNLSARQMAQPQIVDLLRDTLAATGAQPGHLVLEVTESAVMDDIDTTTAVLGQLRSLGVGLAIDDFGTGYSSLTYLRRFPVTTLKVDRSFVAGVTADADDAAIVTSIVQLAGAIGLSCVAEGVETAEQAAWLARAGCPVGQGFLWSRAVDAAELTAWLASRAAPDPVAVPERRTPLRDRGAARTPVTAAAAARITQLQAEGASLHTIAAALNAEGLLTPDGRRWHPRSVARVVAETLTEGSAPVGG